MIFNLTDWKPISRGYLNNINVNMEDEVLFIKTNSAERSGELIQVNFNPYSRWARWMDIRFGTTIQWSIINCDNNRNTFSNLPSDINKEWMIAKKSTVSLLNAMESKCLSLCMQRQEKVIVNMHTGGRT